MPSATCWRSITLLGVLSGSTLACSQTSERAAAAVSSAKPSANGPDAAGFANPINQFDDAQIRNLDDGGEAECGRQDFLVRNTPADIVLVLDRSGSMQDGVDSNSKKPSKWELVVPALQEVISATDNNVSWGLKLFPLGKKAGQCSSASYPKDMQVEVRPRNAALVNAAISNATPDGDGTPTADAIDEAVKYLQSLQDSNPKYILLATDGDPSCSSTSNGSKARPAAIAAVTNAASAGYHTFVVGIATGKGSASKTLGELASAGLEAPASGYYLANTKDELLSAVQLITNRAATCQFPLSSPPPNPDHVGVLIGDQSIHRDPSNADGWNYVDAGMTAIKLWGHACDQVGASGADSVKVVFGCKADLLF
jgi:Mg-chelatase subunit ChlD